MRFLLATFALLCGISSTADAVATVRRVAVQPFAGESTEPYRMQVARIVKRHGFKVVTSLPTVSGTSQYPGLAKEKRLAAFVVADVAQRTKRVQVSFLVWQGLDGSVVGRWELGGPTAKVKQRISKEFWKRLGSSIEKAMAPPSERLPPAPPMRINAGNPDDRVN